MAIGEAYSNRLQCSFYGWSVLSDGELALELPENNCCDMKGAVGIAKKIMPDVWRIVVFVGDNPDVQYSSTFEGDGIWRAYNITFERDGLLRAHNITRQSKKHLDTTPS